MHGGNVEQYLKAFLVWHKKRCLKHKAEDENQAETQKAEEKKRFMQQKKEEETWINKHGSSYLQKLLKLNFDHEKQYVLERARMEFPDYTVDFEAWFKFSQNDAPSEKALDELIRVEELNVNNGKDFKAIPANIYYEDGDAAPYHEGVL